MDDLRLLLGYSVYLITRAALNVQKLALFCLKSA